MTQSKGPNRALVSSARHGRTLGQQAKASGVSLDTCLTLLNGTKPGADRSRKHTRGPLTKPPSSP